MIKNVTNTTFKSTENIYKKNQQPGKLLIYTKLTVKNEELNKVTDKKTTYTVELARGAKRRLVGKADVRHTFFVQVNYLAGQVKTSSLIFMTIV